MSTRASRYQLPDGIVEAIKVGDEWHSIVDDDGRYHEHVATTEQCDNCGANHFSLTPDLDYTCDSCGFVPMQSIRPESEVVFMGGRS